MVASSKPPTASRQRDRPSRRRLRPGSPHHGGTPTSSGGSAGRHGVPPPLSRRSGTRHPLPVATQSRDVRGPAERSHPARARLSCPDSACAAGPIPRRQRAAAGAAPRRGSRTSRPHFRVMWVLALQPTPGRSESGRRSAISSLLPRVPWPRSHNQAPTTSRTTNVPAMIANHIATVLPAAHATPLPASSHPVAAMPMVITTSWRRPPPRSPCNAVSPGPRASPHALAPRTGRATSAHAAMRAVLATWTASFP